MGDIRVKLLDDDEPLPPDAVILPRLDEMDPEMAVRRLMEEGLDEVDARFHLAVIRGETTGDTHAVDDDGRRVRAPRQHRSTV